MPTTASMDRAAWNDNRAFKGAARPPSTTSFHIVTYGADGFRPRFAIRHLPRIGKSIPVDQPILGRILGKTVF